MFRFAPILTRSLSRDDRGSIAIKFAFIIPVVALLGLGAIDLSSVASAKGRLQDIADAAALAGANDLSLVDQDAAVERATAYVMTHLEDWPDAPDVKPNIQVVKDREQRIIEVALAANRPSFFGSILPPGGWNFEVRAGAVAVGMTPLCVLITGGSGDKALNVKDSGRITAPACMVHSNKDILVEGGSITAAFVQAVLSASGVITPKAGTGAAAIPDPFVDLAMDEKQPCPVQPIKEDIKAGTIYLAPGIHCGGYKMAGTSKIVLDPGEHWFLGGHLEIKEQAELSGVDVVLFFDKKSKFEFKDQASVNLDGRKTGAYAGMVMVGTRGNSEDFIITSDHVRSLLGVIYVPQARLIVEGKSNVAQDSAWTVIVARELQLKGSPSLVVNANYQSSSVPVPEGVGPRQGGSQLVE